MQSIFFDLLHLYYLPQFLPVANEMRGRGIYCEFVVYESNDLITGIMKKALEDEDFTYQLVKSEESALDYYLQKAPTWILFSNFKNTSFTALQKARGEAQASVLVFMQHGIGPKATYYDTSSFDFDIRFVEGEVRRKRLAEQAPNKVFVDVGYAKLDPLFNEESEGIDLQSLQLDPNKPTLLYAPTFFPSSIERFPKNWPEMLSDYNLIIKPHFFSLSKSKYKRQRKRLSAWAKYPNTYLCKLEEYSLLPFMKVSDVMLSEASSTIFEFAAMDKPIVWCDFFHLRWNYRGPLKFRLGKRMDEDLAIFHELCMRAKSPKEVSAKIAECIANPQAQSETRKRLTLEMAGITDGKCSQRIADYLLS